MAETLGMLVVVAVLLLLSSSVRIAYTAISFYFLTPLRIKKIMKRQGITGPKPRFLLGNISEISSLVSKSNSNDISSISNHDIVTRLMPHYVLWSKQYGKRFIYWNGCEPRLCLTEPELIRELLSKYSIVSGKSWMQQQGSKNFIGRGLLMANGEDWYHQRRIVTPAFTGEKLKSYAKYTIRCTEEMLKSMENAINSGQTEFEISEYMRVLTADIISRVEFGSCCSEKGKEIYHLVKKLQRLCAQSSRHLCIPGSRFLPSKYNRQIKSLRSEVDTLLTEIIESRRASIEVGRSSAYGNDLLGVLLNEMQRKRSGSGRSVDLELIMDECKTFFFAGHETTSLLLTWTIMLLASNQNWQDRVRAEVSRVCHGKNPSVDCLSKLTSLNMVINESLRLYPPASILPRMAFEDINLGDLRIPKGLSIWIPVLAIHHDEQFWGHDVNEFNPTRFESRSSNLRNHFIPFGVGPRNCIGQSFALMETKIILAMLASKFNFSISENYRHAPIVILTIKPKYGVQICIKPLKP